MLLALLCTIILIAVVAGLFFSVGLAAALIGGLFMGISRRRSEKYWRDGRR